LKLQALNFYSKRILCILLLFLFLNVYGQEITVENKSNSHIVGISYQDHKIKLSGGQKKLIALKGIDFLHVEYTNEKGLSKNIPLFLNPGESLTMGIENYAEPVRFTGAKDALHDLLVNQLHYILYKNIPKYQDLYSKNNQKALINFTEMVLLEYLNKMNI
jgi:hypothetical protein